MTFVVTESCIKCKYTDCVDVCPVDCFYEGENMLVIHPDQCIDCGVCEPECPIDADTEPGLEHWLNINATFSTTWPNITRCGWTVDDVLAQMYESNQPSRLNNRFSSSRPRKLTTGKMWQ